MPGCAGESAAVAKAADLHHQGYNCAESVLGGVLSQLAVEPLPLRAATGFGGGIGRRGDVCGAVTGAVIAISWARGRDRPDDREAYAGCSALVREVLAAFRREFGTLICRELTGYDLSDPSVVEAFADDRSRRAKCARYIEAAALLTARVLLEESGSRRTEGRARAGAEEGEP